MIFHTYFPRPLLNSPFHYPLTDNLLIKKWHQGQKSRQHQETRYNAGAEKLFLKQEHTRCKTPGAVIYQWPYSLGSRHPAQIWLLSYLSLNTPDTQQLDATRGPSKNAEEKRLSKAQATVPRDVRWPPIHTSCCYSGQ